MDRYTESKSAMAKQAAASFDAVRADTLLSQALLGRASTSASTDDERRVWIWAGHVGAEEAGDGTRECRILVTMGLLGADEPEESDGEVYHCYQVTALGDSVRERLRLS